MAFLMNHGEKIVAAIFAMLGCLALSSANWATTDKSFIALEKTANDNKAKIDLNEWPVEDKTWFQAIDDVVKITSEEGGNIVNVADYQIAPFTKDLLGAKEKRSAVAVLAPIHPRAVAVVFPLAKPAEEEDETDESAGADQAGATDTEDGEEASMTDEEKAAELLAKKFGKPVAAPTAGIGGAGGYGADLGLGSEDYGYGEGEGMEEQMEEMYSGGGYGEDYGEEMYAQYGEGMMNVTKKNIEVVAGVSATMVIDLQRQREMVRKALHLKGNYLVAQNEILYVDLKVERRRTSGKPTEWEPISSDDLAEILTQSLGFDRDVVSQAVTRSAITMPLPRRAAGEWQASDVSHPKVEDFELSPEEKELIDKWNKMVTERIAEAEEAAPVKVEPRGFSGFAQTSTEMGAYGGYGSGMEPNYEEMYDDYEDSMGSGEGGQFKLTDAQKQLLDETKATAEHRLLLVRFMDFTVERGQSYQYRARVVMKNPNYDYALDELEDPALAAEPELVSDWSDATNSIFVPFGSRTYLSDVDARNGQQERATIKIYSDTTETGLSILGAVKVPMGMPIAGVDSLEVVDLTTDSLEPREVNLKTNELLVAAEELSRTLTGSDHPDLKKMLDKLDRSMKPIPDQISVVDSTGALKIRLTGDMSGQEDDDRAEYDGILKLYEPWKTKAAGPAGNDFFGEGGDEEGYGSEMSGYGGEGLGMGQATSSSYKGGRRMSSREAARKRRSGELPPRGMEGGGYSE